MPHAEQTFSPTTDTMAPAVNGEKASSAFISVSVLEFYILLNTNHYQHLTSYPVVSDSIKTFKSNPYGAKSVELSNHAYVSISKPLAPYLSKPYEYMSPYVVRADSLGDAALSKVDERAPFVKKPTSELIDNGKGVMFFPLKKGGEAKEYVFKTYNSEVKKVGGEGIVTYGKAAVTTTLIVSSDALSWLSDFLSAKKEQAKEVSNEKLNN